MSFISNDGPAHECADSAGYRRAGFTPSLATDWVGMCGIALPISSTTNA
jgi:hypothetical protein